MATTASWKRSTAPLFFILDSLVSQACGLALVVILWKATGNLTVSLLCGTMTASAMALFMALPFPWQLLNLITIPASAISLSVEVPSWVFLSLLLFTVLIYAPAFWTRVPYYPTSSPAYLMLLAEMPRDKEFTFVDLGCGFGDLLLFLSKHAPNGRYVGVEIGILPYLVAKIRAFIFGKGRIQIRCISMWKLPLAEFDVVYTFLSPAPMARIWEKVSQEMKQGSLFITNSFTVPGTPTRAVSVKDDRDSVLYAFQR